MGYEIGSHGNRHIDYSKLSEAEIREQIKKAHRIITEVAGVEPELIRAPHGDINKSVLKVADELGYKVIQWDTDSKDRLNPGVDQIVQNVVQKAHKGDIILMHASDSATQTHLALPKIIDQLRNKGFEFVTVSELIEGTEAENQEIN